MHFGNCFCKPHNDVVWPNQHLNPFQIGLCLAKPSLCGYKQHFPKHFQRGVYTAAIWKRLCKWTFRGTVHFLLETTSQVTVHACEWVFLTVSYPDRDIFVLAQGKSWHSWYQEYGTHTWNRSTSVYTSFVYSVQTSEWQWLKKVEDEVKDFKKQRKHNINSVKDKWLGNIEQARSMVSSLVVWWAGLCGEDLTSFPGLVCSSLACSTKFMWILLLQASDAQAVI